MSDQAAGTLGRRTHPLTAVVQGLGWSFAATVGLVGSIVSGGQIESWSLIALPAAAVGGVVVGSLIGWLSWRFTRFVIDDSEARLDSGIIWRSSRRVPFERLQSVDIHQPFVARVLGLAELRLDSAGGKESRTTVRYLTLPEAHELRALLLRRAHASETGSDAGDATPPPPPGTAEGELVAVVPPSRVVIGTILSLDFVGAVVVAIGAIVASVWFAAPLAALGGLIGAGSWVVRIVAERVVQQWGYRLTRVEHGLRIERGLLSRTSETVPFERVQGVAVVEPLIWRQSGWSHLLVSVAGGGGGGDAEDQERATTLLTIADRELTARVVDLLVPGAVQDVEHRRRAARAGWLFAPIGWRFRWIGSDDVAAVSRTGWITRRTSILPFRKSQSVAVEQGPLQRLLGVTSVAVHSPDGPVAVGCLHLSPADATAAAEEVRARICPGGAQASMRSRSSS
ncbi:PH domain-containing protein [Aeromicrobium alkaliterrae]|uniref:PH domain-containing protein n=1 Tax=Aeromicrobium alkaliterrae TaxID=302168 RepID=A0ABP4VN28_9ACTN